MISAFFDGRTGIMAENILIAMILCLFALSSCRFLDGGTVGIVDNDRMFENEQGFIDAMNGVYASMTDKNLYGESLSFGLIDELAQLYYNDSQANETILTKTIGLKYTDSDVRAIIDKVWETAYNVIASANSIIDNASSRDYPCLGRITGEALAVRAFIHFDMLRLFASSYSDSEAKAIPYVIHFTNTPVPYSTVKETYNMIVSDMEASIEALKSATIVPGRRNKSLYMDYYSACAFLARVHNWASNNKAANHYALEALKGAYKLTREENIKSLFHGYIANDECLWGLHAPKMYMDVKKRLMPIRIDDRTDVVRLNFRELFAVDSYTSTHNDYRYQSYFTEGRWGAGTTAFSKLYDKYYDENQQASSGRIPGINLIRLPELYYILAESEYDTDKEKARNYLNEVVTARGLNPIGLEDISSRKAFENILVKEIVKEYWGEGQAFFTYKRFGFDMNGVDGHIHKASNKVYILPAPESEKENGL